MVMVKKYGNRRLYDTSASTYVTLSEVAAKIRQGEEVRLVDAKTDEDLTQQMLVQIIFEDPDTARLLPATLLVQLVRMGQDALAEFFSRYLTWALDVYQKTRQGMAAMPLNPFAPAAFGMMNPLASMFGAPPAPPPPPSSSDDVAALRRELDELRRELRKRRR